MNNSVFIENLPSSEHARARARANHAKMMGRKDAQCNFSGITLNNKSLFDCEGGFELSRNF